MLDVPAIVMLVLRKGRNATADFRAVKCMESVEQLVSFLAGCSHHISRDSEWFLHPYSGVPVVGYYRDAPGGRPGDELHPAASCFFSANGYSPEN